MRSLSFRKRPGLWLLVLWLAVMYGIGLYSKVMPVEAKFYRADASEIRATARWRYGYVCMHHGAELVRTRNTPAARTPEPQEPDSDPDLLTAMTRELDSVPRKAAGEGLLYLTFLAYVAVLAPWCRARVAPTDARAWWRIVFEGMLWAAGWAMVLLPLVVGNYGASLYTTWAGPGALSWSGAYPGMVTGEAGETVSYRAFVEAVGIFPVLFGGLTGLDRLVEDLPMGTALGALGAIGGCVLGMLKGGLACFLDRRR